MRQNPPETLSSGSSEALGSGIEAPAPAAVAPARNDLPVAHDFYDILRRTRGRAFVLFTSYAVMRAVQHEIEMHFVGLLLGASLFTVGIILFMWNFLRHGLPSGGRRL